MIYAYLNLKKKNIILNFAFFNIKINIAYVCNYAF